MERPERGLEGNDDPRAVEEAEKAAAEAAGIGGTPAAEGGDDQVDPAMAPVYEGGGGEAEGFEQAEDLLIARATHSEQGGNPQLDEIREDADALRSGASYGDPDEIEASALQDPEQFQAQDPVRPHDTGDAG